MIDFIRCHFCSRANSILEATRRFLIVHSPALLPSMCKSVETCLYKNRRRKKNESTKMENVISRTLLVIPSYLDINGARGEGRGGGTPASSSRGAVRTFVNVHGNIVDIISIVVSRPAEYRGRAQDEIPVRGGPTPQQHDTAKLIHRVLLEYLIKLMKDLYLLTGSISRCFDVRKTDVLVISVCLKCSVCVTRWQKQKTGWFCTDVTRW